MCKVYAKYIGSLEEEKSLPYKQLGIILIMISFSISIGVGRLVEGQDSSHFRGYNNISTAENYKSF